ncbi:MAG: GH3 auxin-responsive promoter family protein [Calothrix sp. C42_A2020_038]|nr:GH3 auxin-responsive promoter family protein [Calothrix sp. C42_A2020_038]
MILSTFVRLQGWRLAKQLDIATLNPEAAQMSLLYSILAPNAETIFGKEHKFSHIKTACDYYKSVPIRDYEGFRPYVNRILAGEKAILTSESPFMFTLTSGTTGKPKYIPVTEISEKLGSGLMRQWLYRILINHPKFLSRAIVGLVSPAIEGYTESKIPYGSISGRIYQRIPHIIKRSYAVPYSVFELKDYDERYFAIARFAYGRQVSFISTPNPTTLLRLAEVATTHKEDIIRAIHDGTLGIKLQQKEITLTLQRFIKPQPQRAKQLERIADNTNALLPKDCWQHLQLIGCWTGGSVGIQVQKLATYYGAVPIRDLGYLASEARITIPYQDNIPSGILALTINYYEFIPEEELDSDNPPILLSHELELGKRYSILLTTTAGLYRYQIHDIVEVTGFYNQSPLIAFIRKSQDMTNITGEKMHVNHILTAMETVRQQFNLAIVTYRFTPDIENQRYKIYLELAQSVEENQLKQIVLVIDSHLCSVNCEYEQKRQSKRLHLPCLYIMSAGWAEQEMRQEMMNGKRNVQYKWKVLCHEFEPLGYVTASTNSK